MKSPEKSRIKFWLGASLAAASLFLLGANESIDHVDSNKVDSDNSVWYLVQLAEAGVLVGGCALMAVGMGQPPGPEEQEAEGESH